MKIRTEKQSGEEEIVIRSSRAEQIKPLIVQSLMHQQRFPAQTDQETYSLPVDEIYYFEVVDGISFIYTGNEVHRTRLKLSEFLNQTSGSMIFRAGKSLAVHAGHIISVHPLLSGRMEATLDNGEKVAISRQYVKDLKERLGMR